MVVANSIHKLSDAVNKLCGVLCIIMLTSMVAITGAQIVCRVFFTALTWSEELTRYLLVWSTFIGGSIVYKYGGHISVTLILDLLPPSARKTMAILVHVICGAFCAISIYYGVRYMSMQGSQLSAAMRVPMRFVYLAIPVGFMIIELHVVDTIIRMLEKGEEVQA